MNGTSRRLFRPESERLRVICLTFRRKFRVLRDTQKPASRSTNAGSRKASSEPAGPGGRNVSRLSTAVRPRFNVRGSPSLPDDVRARLDSSGAPASG